MNTNFFSKRETVAISMYLGDMKHVRQTRAYLLGRCNNDPIKVLDYFRQYVTREEFDGNEILQRIAEGLRKEGLGHKIRFKPSDTTAPEAITLQATKASPMDKFRSLSFADVLIKRSIVKYAIPALS